MVKLKSKTFWFVVMYASIAMTLSFHYLSKVGADSHHIYFEILAFLSAIGVVISSVVLVVKQHPQK